MGGLKRLAAGIAIAGALCGGRPHAADAPQASSAVANFYKGKTVQVLVGFGPGRRL